MSCPYRPVCAHCGSYPCTCNGNVCGCSSHLNLAYGGRYHPGPQVYTIGSPHTDYQLVLDSVLPLNRMGANDHNGLIIRRSGIYFLQYNLLGSASGSVNMAAAARRDGEIIPETRVAQNLCPNPAVTGDGAGRLSAMTIVSLSAGEVVDAAIWAAEDLPDGLSLTVGGYANATLILRQLS